jgi:hypothetical protein
MSDHEIVARLRARIERAKQEEQEAREAFDIRALTRAIHLGLALDCILTGADEDAEQEEP